MANERTLIDLIAALSEEEFARMREINRRELERLRVELKRVEVQEHQFELAAAKKGRKKIGRPGKLSPEVVLDAATRTEPPMKAADVRDTLVADGLDVSVNAVRNHLNALVDAGELVKDEEGRYSLPAPAYIGDFPSSPTDDDIPF